MDPDLARLLLNNEAPTQRQAHGIQCLLEAGREKLSKLDDTILKLSLVLSEVKSQRHCCQQSLSGLICVRAPIRRVPPEILAEIFHFSCRTYENSSITDVQAAPLLLGRVCSLWRAIAQNTPCLWDTVHVRSVPTDDRSLSFIRTLLGRSRALPLDITLTTRSADHGRSLALVFEPHERIQRMHLNLSRNDCVPTLVADKPWPLLSRVKLEANYLPEHAGIPLRLADILNVCRHASALRTLIIRSNLSFQVTDSHFPWSQLTLLDLQIRMDIGQAVDILARCTKLERCRFFIVDGVVNFEAPSPPQTLEQLDRLHLCTSITTRPPVDALLRFFTLPSLRSLYIAHVRLQAPVLSEFILRSQLQLEVLSLRSTPLESNEILSLLRLQPTLRHLTLSTPSGVMDPLILAFTYTPGSPPRLALPQLDTLNIEESTDELDGTEVADMVESLADNAGSEHAPFRSITSVVLTLNGELFSTSVEDRLASAVLTGFLTDTVARY
ncbi:hypothetical protein C8R46DRAFT_1300449 [Mycena filopes]|nr:hypothetical protein C8R46DRAFT_1300449 [Mycena filopes]